ncbi:hypothetical protein SAMN05216179_2697 [Gracilibacillus kekensis]|uniref:Immunity MXAN-0049 protein domain-containing protein n=1 Tax=Gracilibacillus kekensis TaxID=1027249 RepID=A0A1M7Q0W4_9BACI|nr:hypothetical protein SAMN05216179_2697 [Gracilibacillus kekensis]
MLSINHTNNYYIMLIDTPWAGPNTEVRNGPGLKLLNGTEVTYQVIEPFEIKLAVDDAAGDPLQFKTCDIHGPNRTTLFSKRLIELLKQHGVENVQYFDTNVVYEPTGEFYDYKMVNIIGLVKGLNEQESELLISERGTVLDIEKMVFDEEKLEGYKLCRLQEDSMLVVVHRSIKEAIEKAGLTGFLFVTDDEFEPGMI